ncbi:MAG: SWIM zinc finger family protein [Dehalococcoidia bacterium]|nr:SWIM zinc finger family protein [Dehalococcoidia bacterium]
MIGTIEELRLLIKDAAMRRPHLTGRLEKAAFLVLLRPIECLGTDLWRVGSEDGLRFYTVREGECECSDYLRHGSGHPCKHRIALFLHRSLENGAGERAEEKQNVGGRREGRVPRGFRA